MPKTTQFCIGIDNKPGTLAKMSAALSRAKVNIDALSIADNTECCWVRLVASPAAAAKKVLTKGKYNFCTQRVLRLEVKDQPGELQRIASKLAANRVNIHYAYGSTCKRGPCMLVLSVNNLDKAAKLFPR